MSKQPEALRLADALLVWEDEAYTLEKQAAAELRRLTHNNTLLMNALLKACADDEETAQEIIHSQGELK